MAQHNDYDFQTKLAYSKGVVRSSDRETIQSLIPGCVEVREASVELDKRGIDYIAVLRRGATLNIDIKVREKGVSRNWSSDEPELTLEIWSVMPSERCPKGKTGWTLDESKLTDYVLYLFHPDDTKEVFLLPFQLLRMAMFHNLGTWKQQFFVGQCNSNGGPANGGWSTQSVFVPSWCVIDAIEAEMRQRASL